jgi:hypothetical protein
VIDFASKIEDQCSLFQKSNSKGFANRQAARKLLPRRGSWQGRYISGVPQSLQIVVQNNAAVQELRPLFTMDGIEPDGLLSVTEEFREQVLSLAKANPAAACGLTLPAPSHLGH